MIVLGITDSFVSGAAVAVDGAVVAAVNEERLNRLKMSMGFPALSVAEVLRVSGIEPAEIDSVAVATTTLFWRCEAALLVPSPALDLSAVDGVEPREVLRRASAGAS